MATPFLIGPAELKALDELREIAATAPVDVRQLQERIKTPDGKAAHRDQMTAQTVVLPLGWLVTFSIEIGHPAGPCRHMSMSSPRRREGLFPLPDVIWLVAEALGFSGGLKRCASWAEQLEGHGGAINVVQPINVGAEARDG